METTVKIRQHGVDTVRVAAILAVIAIHTKIFRYQADTPEGAFLDTGYFLNQLARFAVPFFFIISGYFWGRKLLAGVSVPEATLPMLRKLLLVFAAWCVIYLLPYNLAAIPEYGWLGPLKANVWRVKGLLGEPWVFAMEGTLQLFWYLLALMWGLVVTALLARHRYILAVTGFVLFAVGCLGQAYIITPYGVELPFNSRSGPLFSTLFFATGYFLTAYTPDRSWFLKGLVLMLGGYALHFGELYWIWSHYGPVKGDFVFGTYLVGLGVALMALSNHPLLASERIASLGKYTLGIYAVHYIFVENLLWVKDYWVSPVWETGNVLLVYALSLGTIYLMCRSTWLRKICM